MKTRLLIKLRREAKKAFPIFPSTGHRQFIRIQYYYRMNYIQNMVYVIRCKKNRKNNG